MPISNLSSSYFLLLPVLLCIQCGCFVSCSSSHNIGKLSNGLPTSQVKPIHKWPLRPGVHVHVNGLNTLAGSDCNKVNQISGFSYGAKNSSSSSSASDSVSNASSNPDTGGCDSHPRGEALDPDSSGLEHSQVGMVTSTPSYSQVKGMFLNCSGRNNDFKNLLC